MKESKEYNGGKIISVAAAIFGVLLVASILFSLSANPQPSINGVNDSPDPVEIPGYNNITVTVSAGPYFPYDTTGNSVNDVRVIIYYPDGTLWGNFSMTRIDSTTTWYFNHTYDASFPLGKYTYYIWAVDAYDWNESGPYNFTLQDTTPPSSSLTIQGPYWDNDGNIDIYWNASDNVNLSSVEIYWNYSSDNISWGGWTRIYTIMASGTYDEGHLSIMDVDEGWYRIALRAIDSKGNVEWDNSTPIMPPAYAYNETAIDTTPPETTKSFGTPTYGPDNVWVNLSTAITLSATDPKDNASGVNATYYRIWYDGGWHPNVPDDSYGGNNNIANYDGTLYYVYHNETVDFGPIYFTEECVHYIEFFSVDNATNEENHTIQAHYVDNTPPEVAVEYGQPNYVNGSGAQFITKDTPIYLNATDDNDDITKLSPGLPMVWPFWTLISGSSGYNISAIVENYYIGTVQINASYNVSDSSVPLSSLTWDNLAVRTWTPEESYDITTMVPTQLLSPIPISQGDAAVIVRYNVTVDGNVVARFIGEALLSWSGSTPSIVGTLTNFDVHNNFTLVNNFELEIEGLSEGNITEYYPGWGTPANVTDDGNWVNITWINVTDPIYYCNWVHFGLGLDGGVILGDITDMKANWTVKCAVGSYRIWYRIWNETGAMTEPISGTWNQSVVFNLSQLGITENCIHHIEYWTEDDLGNTQAQHFNETVYVDNTPPDINMTIGQPQYPGVGGTFINFSTPIWVNATDNGTDPCIVGSVNLTVDVYNATTGARIAHYTTEVESGWAHIGPFHITEECVHWINITARDDLNNTAYHNETVYVDNMPPSLQKEIGEPKYENEETILFEDFREASGSPLIFPPSGWTDECDVWGASGTNLAGGTIPEAVLDCQNAEDGCKLYTYAINTTGYTELLLSFKTYVDDFNGGYTLHVATSTDGNSWHDVWSISPTSDYGPSTEYITLTGADGVGSPTFYIAFIGTGSVDWGLNDWYIDDVKLEGKSLFITSQTPIYLNITDDGLTPECTVDSLHVRVGIWYDGDWNYTWHNQSNSPMNLTIYLHEECIHYLNITAWDDLGNMVYDNETFHVDNTSPDINKTIGEPKYPKSSEIIEEAILSEGFESDSIPANWTNEIVSGNYVWGVLSNTQHPGGESPHSGNYMACYPSWSAPSGNKARLYTPKLDFTNYSDCNLTFWMYHDTTYSSSPDRVVVQASLDGATWTNITTIHRYDGSDGWKEHSVDLSAYDGQSSVYIGFLAISEFGSDIYIDDVNITGNTSVIVAYYVNFSTPIWVNATDNGTDPCIVGSVNLTVDVYNATTGARIAHYTTEVESGWAHIGPFHITEECVHWINITARDDLNNTAYHNETVYVDNTPPVSAIDPITPYCQHINATNPLTISSTITDYPNLCASGVYNATLWYRYARYNHSFTHWFMFGTDTSSPWQWNFTAPNGSGYYQFYVASYDNLGQQEHPFPPNETTSPKGRVSASYNHTFELVYNHTGWNLITMPVKHKNIHKANDLVEYIDSFSPDICTVITRWDRENQQYVSYVVQDGEGYGVNFSLVPGEGYFVYVTANITIYMEGCLIEYDEINMALKLGYNMIGWANLEPTNASRISGNISGCTKVTKWNASSQRWFIPEYIASDPSHDFNITIGEAMFAFRPTGGNFVWDGGRSMLVLPPP